MLRIAVVEDDKQVSEQLLSYLQHYSQRNNLVCKTKAFYNGSQIAGNYSPEWDIIFLDIQMPVMDGMEAARLIRQADPAVILIFITNLAQYAMKGYKVNALDYVLKPVDENQFHKCLDAAIRKLSFRGKRYLSLRTRDDFFRIDTDEIRYIQVYQHSLLITLRDETVRSARGTISQVEAMLDPFQFAKCNSGILVNLRYVTRIQGDRVILDNTELPLSRRKRKSFMQAVADYLGGVL